VRFLPERVEDLLGRVRDVLLLDDRFPLILQVIGHKDANGSAFERTVDAFTPLPPITMRQYFPGLRGLGLRITFEQPPYVCDLRIEPLFSDPPTTTFNSTPARSRRCSRSPAPLKTLPTGFSDCKAR
jgi:hypothetical protein